MKTGFFTSLIKGKRSFWQGDFETFGAAPTRGITALP
jgi:hypothetical protein